MLLGARAGKQLTHLLSEQPTSSSTCSVGGILGLRDPGSAPDELLAKLWASLILELWDLIKSQVVQLSAIAQWPAWTLEVQSREYLILVGFMEGEVFEQSIWTYVEELEDGGWERSSSWREQQKQEQVGLGDSQWPLGLEWGELGINWGEVRGSL